MAQRREWKTIALAALAAAAIAFPAGIMFAERDPASQTVRGGGNAPPEGTQARDFYSPNFASDPYVIGQQRRVVEALERLCAQSGERCAEARLARSRVEEAARP